MANRISKAKGKNSKKKAVSYRGWATGATTTKKKANGKKPKY